MPIYLDYAATTPVDPRVAAAMIECLTSADAQGNAASATHGAGLAARDRVERARAQVAALIGAQPREIIFTSGATEANNLALFGVARAARRVGTQRGHIVSSRMEHKSVLDALTQLEKDGFLVTRLEPDEWGRIVPQAVRGALRTDTLLVSLMHANNELGCVSDIAAIAALCNERGVLLHTDASQSAGKLPLDLQQLPVDLLSLTAHKIYGPKGMGALFVRESARPRIGPVVFGGGHERGLRSGTLPTHQIVGFGAAAELAKAQLEVDATDANELRARLARNLGALPGVTLNTLPGDASLPGILNISFEGVEGESLVTGLAEIEVSTGSACSSASREPSYVLRALGRSPELAQSSLRLSFGRYSTASGIDAAAAAIRREVSRLRLLAGGADLPGVHAAAPVVELAGTLCARSLSPLAQHYFFAAPRIPEFASAPPPAAIRQGRAGSQAQGTAVYFELQIDADFVRSARFSVYGCPHTLAVASWLCEVLTGAKLPDALPGKPADWAEKFAVPVEKLGPLLIIEDALRAALAG